MNKRILFSASIATASLIILVSFTNAIELYTTEASAVTTDSPLFHIRTEKAIKKENTDVITYKYFGKNSSIVISFPKMNNSMQFILQLLNKISSMDKKLFQRYLDEAKEYTCDKKEINRVESLPTSYYLRKNINNSILENINKNFKISNENTINNQLCSVGHVWIPGCIIVPLLLVFFIIFIRIITFTIFCTFTSPCEF